MQKLLVREVSNMHELLIEMMISKVTEDFISVLQKVTAGGGDAELKSALRTSIEELEDRYHNI